VITVEEDRDVDVDDVPVLEWPTGWMSHKWVAGND
jgi:hypothetical protein